MKPKIYLLVGNIGSGKSTFVKKIRKDNPLTQVVSLDAIRYMLGGGEYIFNRDTEHIVWSGASRITSELMDDKHDIIIDECLISKERRAKYISKAKEQGYEIIAVEFPLLTKEEAISRRMTSNHGNQPKEVWEGVYTRFNNGYQAPSSDEGIDTIIQLELRDIGLK